MTRRPITSLALCLTLAAGGTLAAAPAPKTSAETPAPPGPEESVTQHTIHIAGVAIPYEATAGTLVLRNEKDEPVASIGYFAYIRSDVSDPAQRPITFAYNGGPGSSSIWLHMGALGPRRIVTTDAAPTPPAPYRVIDNASSILDKSDLVMIDPVGTGFSRPAGKGKGKDFWGVDEDVRSVGDFIVQYVTDTGRWLSPKYLLGESYGTMRSAGVVDYLQTRKNMAINGVVLVSVFVDAPTSITERGNDLAFELFLPTYSAIAWYHHAIDDPPADLATLLDQARAFAAGPYADALMKGDRLAGEERRAVLEKMAHFTGLSTDYLDKANLRVTEGQFTQELLRSHGETVGRLDSRFTGVSFDRLAEESSYDPQEAAISSAFTAAFLSYLHDELAFGGGKTYHVEADLWEGWNWKHKAPGSSYASPGWPHLGVDLAHAMGYNPNLRVLVLNGYYDLATPFFATEYTMEHLGLPPDLADHYTMKYFEAGHMMYLHEPALVEFKQAVAAFIAGTDRL